MVFIFESNIISFAKIDIETEYERQIKELKDKKLNPTDQTVADKEK